MVLVLSTASSISSSSGVSIGLSSFAEHALDDAGTLNGFVDLGHEHVGSILLLTAWYLVFGVLDCSPEPKLYTQITLY